MTRLTPVLLSDRALDQAHASASSAAAMAAALNAWAELWHPGLLPRWAAGPEAALASDHAEPRGDHLYVLLPDQAAGLSEDWPQRAARAGGLVVRAAADRAETRRALHDALQVAPAPEPPPAFFGLGYGCWLLHQLADLMGHPNALDSGAFLDALRQAAQAAGAEQEEKLRAAAEQLRAARDVLYPSTLSMLDLALLDGWPAETPPLSLAFGVPLNVIASAARLEEWSAARPADFEALQEAVAARRAEVCGGHYREQPDPLLPTETVFANLRRGWETCRNLLGVEPAAQARARYGGSPLDADLAGAIGQRHVLLFRFDGSGAPTFKGAVLEWPNTGGKSVLALVRPPDCADGPEYWFSLASRLHETIVHDFTALVLSYSRGPEPTWRRDWLALHRLAPVFGQHVTVSGYFSETYASEHPPALPADEFRAVDLNEYCAAARPTPLSGLALAARQRRQYECAAALAGMWAGLPRAAGRAPPLDALSNVGDALARGEPVSAEQVAAVRTAALEALAHRLLLRATADAPGHLVLNPCSFTRRVILELPGVTTPLPAPARATQLDAGGALACVELPPFGFAWLPLAARAGDKIAQPRIAILEDNTLRNEFLEAEIDPQTGGLRELRDAKRKIGRLGLQLVHAAGSRMRPRELRPGASGAALGSLEALGDLVDARGTRVADFKLTYALGWAVPYLTVQIELTPATPLAGDAWENYLGLRLAWRDPAARLARSIGWSRAATEAPRLEAADFLEIASGPVRTVLLTGGLPFIKRQGPRMADLLLQTPGEEGRRFEIALAVDRDEPLLTAEDWLAPAPSLAVAKGPPPGGPTAWLFDLDAAHVLVTSLHPAGDPAADAEGVVLRLVECRGVSGEAQLRCPRQPARAEAIDERGQVQSSLTTVDDTVFLHFSPFEMLRVRLAFTT